MFPIVTAYFEQRLEIEFESHRGLSEQVRRCTQTHDHLNQRAQTKTVIELISDGVRLHQAIKDDRQVGGAKVV